MSRDKTRYPDGYKFMPERFLNAEGMLTDDDPGDFVFGFGRRRCPGMPVHSKEKSSTHPQGSSSLPGRHMADVSLWSAIATMLATLDFNFAKDANGNDITFKARFSLRLSRYVRIGPVLSL